MLRMRLHKIGSCSAVAVLLLSGASAAMEPSRVNLQNFISRAVFASGRLWLLSDSGELSSITPGEKTRVAAGLPEPALDICVTNGQLRALTCKREGCKEWTFRTWTDGRWSPGTVVRPPEVDFNALSCGPHGDTIVSTRHLVTVAAGKTSVVPLSEALRNRAVASIHTTTDHVFVGINAGERGGGLRRIDRKTGKVTVIEKNSSGELCGGPLNTACDPVNAIVDVPWKPGCIAVAIGLVHLSTHGRILEVCQDQVRRTFFKGLGDPRQRVKRPQDDEPFETVAFFGLVRAKNELVAAGTDGVYRFNGASKPRMISLPKFESIGAVGVSFDMPGLVLVLTGINQRRSVSGNVPLLVPR